MRLLYTLIFVVWSGLLYAQSPDQRFEHAVHKQGITLSESAPLMRDPVLRDRFLQVMAVLGENQSAVDVLVKAYAPLLDGQVRRTPLLESHELVACDDLSDAQRAAIESLHEQALVATRSPVDAYGQVSYKSDTPVLSYVLLGTAGLAVLCGIGAVVWQRRANAKHRKGELRRFGGYRVASAVLNAPENPE